MGTFREVMLELILLDMKSRIGQAEHLLYAVYGLIPLIIL